MPVAEVQRVPVVRKAEPRAHQMQTLGAAPGAPTNYQRLFFVVPKGGVKIRAAYMMSDTTLAAAAAAYTTFTIQTVGGVAIATRNHSSAGDGAITADTRYAMTLTAANVDQAEGTILEVLFEPNDAGSPDLSGVSLLFAIEYQPNV